MPTLFITRGISGSGKSTWARAQKGAIVVSRDDLRAALFGSDGPDYYAVDKAVLREREDFITKVEHDAIKRALLAGKNVVSDNTHTMMRYVNTVAKVGYSVGANVEVHVFDVTVKEAERRVQNRVRNGGRAIPLDVLERQHSQLAGSKNDSPVPAPPAVRPYNGTPGKPKAILVDIDGTLAHMRDYREPFDWKNVGKDDPDFNVFQVIRWIRGGMFSYYQSIGRLQGEKPAAIILMSGRDEVCRQETYDWLASWDFGAFDHLFMRPEGDMRKDSLIKAELFDAHVRDNYDVVMVFDDRNQVVDMWRGMGIQVAQVAEGDF